jgi:hypothetical protein
MIALLLAAQALTPLAAPPDARWRYRFDFGCVDAKGAAMCSQLVSPPAYLRFEDCLLGMARDPNSVGNSPELRSGACERVDGRP